ncbi:MAG: hypothetical protein E7376_03050 [Clostridiales bacterium]|nr:hypothetical protein [Clostridiales bacterium]
MDLSKENDNLQIFVKKDKKDLIENCYNSLGWTKTKEQDNEKYEDTINLTYTRPHKIKNKDALQLLQVHVEHNLNELGKLEKNKHAKTTALGFSLGALAIVLCVIGSIYLFYVKDISSIVLCCGIIALGFFLGINTIISCVKIFKKEKIYFENKSNELNTSIKNICKNAEEFLNN